MDKKSDTRMLAAGATPGLSSSSRSAYAPPTAAGTRDKDYELNPEHYAKAGVEELVLVEPVTKGSPKIRRITALKLAAAGTNEEIKPASTRQRRACSGKAGAIETDLGSEIALEPSSPRRL